MSGREIEDAVLQLKGLVLVRALLETRGASEDELAAHSAEIERVRERLSALVAADRSLAAAA